MIRAMAHYMRTGEADSGRGSGRSNGLWEVVGVLAAVIPCGVLAGLYLATSDSLFLLAGGGLAVVAAAIVFLRNPGLVSLRGWRARRSDTASNQGEGRLHTLGARLRRTFTVQILKILGLAAWLVMWVLTASIYARVVENANMAALMMLVLVGGFSPILIYYGLEGGVKKLGRRMRDDE